MVQNKNNCKQKLGCIRHACDKRRKWRRGQGHSERAREQVDGEWSPPHNCGLPLPRTKWFPPAPFPAATSAPRHCSGGSPAPSFLYTPQQTHRHYTHARPTGLAATHYRHLVTVHGAQDAG